MQEQAVDKQRTETTCVQHVAEKRSLLWLGHVARAGRKPIRLTLKGWLGDHHEKCLATGQVGQRGTLKRYWSRMLRRIGWGVDTMTTDRSKRFEKVAQYHERREAEDFRRGRQEAIIYSRLRQSLARKRKEVGVQCVNGLLTTRSLTRLQTRVRGHFCETTCDGNRCSSRTAFSDRRSAQLRAKARAKAGVHGHQSAKAGVHGH